MQGTMLAIRLLGSPARSVGRRLRLARLLSGRVSSLCGRAPAAGPSQRADETCIKLTGTTQAAPNVEQPRENRNTRLLYNRAGSPCTHAQPAAPGLLSPPEVDIDPEAQGATPLVGTAGPHRFHQLGHGQWLLPRQAARLGGSEYGAPPVRPAGSCALLVGLPEVLQAQAGDELELHVCRRPQGALEGLAAAGEGGTSISPGHHVSRAASWVAAGWLPAAVSRK